MSTATTPAAFDPPPDTSPPKPTFHPDFSEQSSGDIILRSSDNVDFYFCPFILSGTSTFFRDVLSIPHPSDEPRILELPSSTSTGLHFVLSILSEVFKGQSRSLPRLRDLCPILEAAMPIIETYDLSVILRLANNRYYDPSIGLTFAQYTLGILAGDEKHTEEAAKRTLRYRIFALTGSEKEMFAFLLKWRTEHAIRLYQLHDPFLTALNDLKDRITKSTFDYPGWDEECVAANGGAGCPTYSLFQGDYTAFCKVLSQRMMSACKEEGLWPIDFEMETVMDVMVECDDCRERIEPSWRELYRECFGKVTALCKT